MLQPNYSNLLRRTVGVLVAASGLFFTATASQAQTITLTGPGTSCSYSDMRVLPNGNVTVTTTGTCGGSTTPPPPPPPGSATFSLNLAAMTAEPNLPVVGLNVVRAGDMANSFLIEYTTLGCATGTGSVSFPANGATSGQVVVYMSTTGPCTVTLVPPTVTGAVLGSITSTIISIPGPAAPPPPPGCPAAPTGTITDKTFAGVFSNNFLMAPSGTVISVPLPNAELSKSSAKLNLASSPSAFSPSPDATTEISITRCPGVIDTDLTNSCNKRWTSAINSVIWYKKPFGSINGPDTSGFGRYCWAPEADGAWFVNIRYTYANGTCGYGASVCGYNFQWLHYY